MILTTNHSDYLIEAFADLRDNRVDIKVSCASSSAKVYLNRNLICLFSPLLREVLASISSPSSAALILPDASSFAMVQIDKIVKTGLTDVGISSFKDINEIVETGKLLQLDLSHLIFEKVAKMEGSGLHIVENIDDTNREKIDKYEEEDVELYHSEHRAGGNRNQKVEICVKSPENLFKTTFNSSFYVQCNNYEEELVSAIEPVPLIPVQSCSYARDMSEPEGALMPLESLPSPSYQIRSILEYGPESSETNISCSNCNIFETTTISRLKKHYFHCKRLNPYARKLECRFCPIIKWKNPSAYHKHMSKKHPDHVYSCDFCEFTTFYDEELKTMHIPKFHGKLKENSNNITSKQVTCKFCDYESPTLKQIKLHCNIVHKQQRRQHIRKRLKFINQAGDRVMDWRKEMGWGPDDQFTCDYWNFVGKGKCRMENGHVDDKNVSRQHTCSLCFRNTGQKECHPAVSCQMFPQPEKMATSHQDGERGPSMKEMGLSISSEEGN